MFVNTGLRNFKADRSCRYLELQIMKTNRFRPSIIGCLPLLLAGCYQFAPPSLADETMPPSIPTARNTGAPTAAASPFREDIPQMTPTLIPNFPSGFQSLIDEAKDDLARRLSAPLSQIMLVEAREVVWPDSSMGCPQPGMAYLQVPEDGALIILQVEGIVYEYHNGGSRGLFLCEKIYKDPNPPPQLDINNLTPSTPDKSTPGAGQ